MNRETETLHLSKETSCKTGDPGPHREICPMSKSGGEIQISKMFVQTHMIFATYLNLLSTAKHVYCLCFSIVTDYASLCA